MTQLFKKKSLPVSEHIKTSLSLTSNNKLITIEESKENYQSKFKKCLGT